MLTKAIPHLESQSFAWKSPPTSTYEQSSSNLIAYNYFSLIKDIERLRERLRQAVDVARENGLTTGDGTELGDGRGGGALAGVNLNSVHLDELPAYEDSRQHAVVGSSDPLPSPPPARDSVVSPSSPERGDKSSPVQSPREETFQAPSEPPPGYEEVQRESVADELERRLRGADRGV